MSLFLLDLNGLSCVFVHVPKTGGTSIRQGDRVRQLSSSVMTDLPDAWKDLPSFGFIRNPFDRIESCWKDFRYLRPRFKYTLEEFLEWVCHSQGDVTDPTTVEHHAAPMAHPVHGLRYAKFLGRYESIQQDFNRFCLGEGIVPFDLPHHRSSEGYPGADWTPRAYELVKERYHQDLELWDGT